ncbi:MAG TPA: protein tyrosine phosphatase family protein [Pyrinomonadaceae bacterium]|nr:protein tyrosine phosphatase family protein [Pyrinomonadaceae bacterium]
MMKRSNRAHVISRLWLTALAAMLALTSMAVSLTQTKTSSSDIVENFGKVNENYYRGSQPSAEGFAKLRKLGIKTVIDLRKDSEAGEPEWVRTAGMQYFNIPLKASHPATAEQTAYFLKLVNDPNNWPVYVHCKGGRHRTGALTAIYRITHDGWTADQAYKEMKEYDFEHGFFGGPTAQKNYVYEFYEQRHAGAGK